MKKHLLLSFSVMLVAMAATGQQKVKDGTTNGVNLPNKDAILELESTNKGLLHTRVPLKATTNSFPLTAHVAGMMVYNTATEADVVPGIYYNDGTKWVFVKGTKGDPGTIIVEGKPGTTGTPGTPGQPGGPGAGVTIVTNDSGTWVYNPTTNTWTNINGPKGDKGDKGAAGVVGVAGLPGTSGTPGIPGSGTPGAPGENITIVKNDSGTWVYIPGKDGAPGTWTNIDGPKGDKGDPGIQSMPGNNGAPGTPGSGTPGAPGTGVTVVHNDSGTWVYNNTTNTWDNIQGPKGDKGDPGIQSMPGNNGAPGTPGSGTPGAPGTGVTVVHNDSGTWVYNNTTNTWDNIKGDAGAVGQTGPAGAAGAAGTQGLPGKDGVDGAAGTSGVAGAVGQTGPAGAAGTQGLPGKDGAAGTPGAAGAVGQTGPVGPAGAAGTQGLPGKDGVDGAAGTSGAAGAVGQTGPAGVAGTQGLPGKDGADGAAGTSGVAGAVGQTGPAGFAGTQGLPGKDGVDGAAGAVGQTGPAGAAGSKGDQGIPGTSIAQTITHTLGSSGNTLTSDVNGVRPTATIINTNVLALSGTNLSSTVNGVTGGVPVDLGPLVQTTQKTTTIVDGLNTKATALAAVGNNTPYKVDVATSNGTTLGVVQAAATNPTVTVTNGVLAVNVANLGLGKDLTTTNGAITATGGTGATLTAVTLAVKANNGLQVANDNVQLGGVLTTATTITADAAKTLAVMGLTTGASTDNVVVSSTNGVLKTVATSTLAIEPWQVVGSAEKATDNAQSIYQNGSVAIGLTSATTAIPSFLINGATINPKLYVAGDISTTGKLWTTNSVYADYVFEKYYDGFSKIEANYKFKSLAEVEAFIKANKHLPGVTSINGTNKTKNGYTFDMTELSIQSLEKLEELYLHVIEQQKQIEAKNKEVEALKENNKLMNERLEKLEKLLLKKG